MRPGTINDILRRFAATGSERRHTRTLVASGDWRRADDDTTRCAAFDARVKRESGLAEAVRGTNDFQPAAFLPEGAAARRAVARVVLQTPTASISGTGFLISPTLFITNQHVVADAHAAGLATLVFDDELDERGLPRPRTIFRLAPGRCALFSDEQDLDYALVALGERVQGDATLVELGYCPISFTPDRHRKGMSVNIIQHPEGMPKTIAIRNNLLTARTDTRLLYETDTDFGSSGAPVYNDQWDVIALHHYGAPSASAQRAPAAGDAQVPNANADADADADLGVAQVNEGIRISSIYQDLQSRLPGLDAAAAALVRDALDRWVDPSPAAGRQLEHRAPTTASGEARVAASETPGAGPDSALALPLSVTVTLGGTAMASATPAAASAVALMPAFPRATETAPAQAGPASAPRPAARTLKHGEYGGLRERIGIDTDYGNRNGFSGRFIPGLKLDLGKIAAPRKSILAPLQESAADGAPGELRYQNFSVLVHKTRRLALFTATNIDGASWLAIDRKTGQPATVPTEGDAWYDDPRIHPSYTVGQAFYSGWSHLFDRGHLTRREDPTWGKFAARANADTFHFTNCTPQHWQFNESLEYWQGIERYVLEKGIFDSGRDKPVTVLQGPVFDDINDLWADDVQVPSAFWKIVVWKGAGGLKAVAMIADQSALFSRQRHGSAPAPKDTPVDVLQWRASIPTIESRTGLDLGPLRAYDTAGADLPVVGEVLMPITRWEDIPLE
ncbi:DNA/RNA non-specific endonuclease [Achromobacter aloeverae]|uniref:Serine protease n=1 Tax=Achromobacter aloeverae TaxID=1750518 RepID=A0A4Q1HDU6_9BURK|nr:DNA/RNA non-specific endonuclease [Achromobacter aloeverae]RXN83391.1 DNA/RNA endonuclease [Achromobacter aloeverae]